MSSAFLISSASCQPCHSPTRSQWIGGLAVGLPVPSIVRDCEFLGSASSSFVQDSASAHHSTVSPLALTSLSSTVVLQFTSSARLPRSPGFAVVPRRPSIASVLLSSGPLDSSLPSAHPLSSVPLSPPRPSVTPSTLWSPEPADSPGHSETSAPPCPSKLPSSPCHSLSLVRPWSPQPPALPPSVGPLESSVLPPPWLLPPSSPPWPPDGSAPPWSSSQPASPWPPPQPAPPRSPEPSWSPSSFSSSSLGLQDAHPPPALCRLWRETRLAGGGSNVTVTFVSLHLCVHFIPQNPPWRTPALTHAITNHHHLHSLFNHPLYSALSIHSLSGLVDVRHYMTHRLPTHLPGYLPVAIPHPSASAPHPVASPPSTSAFHPGYTTRERKRKTLPIS
ncbi:hypothetical protein PO909_020700 [Leuciscus waleckii]